MESIVLGKVALPTSVHKAVRDALSQSPLISVMTPDSLAPHPGAFTHSHLLPTISLQERRKGNRELPLWGPHAMLPLCLLPNPSENPGGGSRCPHFTKEEAEALAK